jgi:transcriptional regulator NrdR family protein
MFFAGCSHCRSVDFRAVGARNAAEGFLLSIMRPQRCSLCGRHFFLFRWQIPAEGTAQSKPAESDRPYG